MTKPIDEKDRLFGVVLGQAIGDALGHPIEFSKNYVVSTLEPNNLFTDDTQMFCAIGEALVSNPPHVNEDSFMEAVATNFIEWRVNPLGGTHRAPGGTCMEAVRRLGTGIPWTDSGIKGQGKGNGTAMRAAVVGAAYWKAPEFAFRIGGLTSVPTHNNLEAILGAAIVASTCAYIIGGYTYLEALAQSLRLASDWQNQFLVPSYPQDVPIGGGNDAQSPWYTIGHIAAAAISAPDADVTVFREINGNDGAVVPAVAAAMFWNSRGSNYSDVTLTAVNNSDDCDTVGAIAGAIAGARFGVSGIRADWTQAIELRTYLYDLAQRLWLVGKDVKDENELDESEIEL